MTGSGLVTPPKFTLPIQSAMDRIFRIVETSLRKLTKFSPKLIPLPETESRNS